MCVCWNPRIRFQFSNSRFEKLQFSRYLKCAFASPRLVTCSNLTESSRRRPALRRSTSWLSVHWCMIF